ncbi:GntR family transcriptional regulator [Streptomyces zhihengii]|uniref:GntR family transcriptional regulator n=1 Tax=Streptomyces zhihengii TaxID=1818004 RepID=UPI00363ECDCD
MPLYRRIADGLRDEIARGVRRPGTLLPSERALCRRFSASRGTVRHALNLLVRERLAAPVQGVGYVVGAAADRLGPDPEARVSLTLLHTAVAMLESCDARADPGTVPRVAALLRAATRTHRPHPRP